MGGPLLLEQDDDWPYLSVAIFSAEPMQEPTTPAGAAAIDRSRASRRASTRNGP
jgi:hypothetical protein